MMKSLFIVIISLTLIMSCTTTQIVHEYKHPDISSFKVNKLFILGSEKNFELKKQFEDNLVYSFEEENIRAVKSNDLFKNSLPKTINSIKDSKTLEKRLHGKGFDAILLTKIIGIQKRYYTAHLVHEFMMSNQTFEDYFYKNQYTYLTKKGKKEDYKVFIIETALYCIPPNQVKELLWKGEIEVAVKKNKHKTINNYIKTLFRRLKEQHLVF